MRVFAIHSAVFTCHDQHRFAVSEAALGWHEIMLPRSCGHSLTSPKVLVHVR